MTITKKDLTPLAHIVALCGVLSDNKDITKKDALELVRNKIRSFAIDNSTLNFDLDKWDNGVDNERNSIDGVIFARTQNIKLVNK